MDVFFRVKQRRLWFRISFSFNSNTDDFEDSDDEVDATELTDEALGQLNFTLVDIDDSYFEETFVPDGLGEYKFKTPLLLMLWYFITDMFMP